MRVSGVGKKIETTMAKNDIDPLCTIRVPMELRRFIFDVCSEDKLEERKAMLCDAYDALVDVVEAVGMSETDNEAWKVMHHLREYSWLLDMFHESDPCVPDEIE